MTDKRFIENPIEAYEKLKQECKALREEKAHADMACEQSEKQINKYLQTLIDIKEIAKNMNKECFYNDFSCDGCDMINGCTYQGKIKVLQKISEVLDDQ